ncbi:MAG TPA: family 10 glycosylhydrolase [Verrucomicrobiae bacterium]
MKQTTPAILGLLALTTFGSLAASYQPSTVVPPRPPREFRGAWIATVGNIDWPSKRGLPVADQKAELISLLDRAAALKLNAVIFQVRPACDALYASKLEPWSEFLTGTMGKAPEPFYDPLALAIAEAHKRGLELHAWFNPYRARVKSDRSPAAANHVSRTRPHLVRDYGRYLWLDPGELETQEYSLSVVLDVVRRYDVDGIHFDDYFYPYRENGADGKPMDFPDEASWKKYGLASKLSRDDWRRRNVDDFIRRVHAGIKSTKPSVKFGLSPFGIWRPGHPPQIQGLDAYAVLYADAKKWLQNGWADYFSPQLYWAIEPKAQSFPVLLDWWNQQNPKRRHLWPGLNTARMADRWKPEETVRQIQLASKQPVSAGHVHWNLGSLLRSGELQSALARGPYAETALVPACPWLDAKAPGQPRLVVTGRGPTDWRASWVAAPGERPRFWLIQLRTGASWSTRVTSETEMQLGTPVPNCVAVSAVDLAGNASRAAVVQLKE